jgi:hypothetical protein
MLLHPLMRTYSVIQVISSCKWSPEVHYCHHKSQNLDPTQNQLNAVQNIKIYFPKFRSIIIIWLSSTLHLSDQDLHGAVLFLRSL